MGCSSSKNAETASQSAPQKATAIDTAPTSTPTPAKAEAIPASKSEEPISVAAASAIVVEKPAQEVLPSPPVEVSTEDEAAEPPKAVDEPPVTPTAEKEATPVAVKEDSISETTIPKEEEPAVSKVEGSAPADNAAVVADSNYATPTEAPASNNVDVDIPTVADPEPVAAPAVKKGFILKQGHKVKNWKNRYFVLEAGKLTYYEKSQAEAPYGVNMKGEMLMDNVTIKRTGTMLSLSKNPPSPFKGVLRRNSSKHSAGNLSVEGDGVTGGHIELLLDIKFANERDEWAKSIQDHINYCEAK